MLFEEAFEGLNELLINYHENGLQLLVLCHFLNTFLFR